MTEARAPRNLTVGDDASPGADAAWSWVTSQTWPGWRVDVVQTGSADGTSRSRARHAPRRCGFGAVRMVPSPLEPAVAVAQHRGSDLVVVGDPAATDDGASCAGGALAWLVRHCTVPVLLARGPRPVRSVLVCVGATRRPRLDLDAVVGLPWMASASVTVLSVRGAEEGAPPHAVHAVAALSDAGMPAHLRVVESDRAIATSSPAFRILEVAERQAIDLVVLGDFASGLVRWLRGSVGRDIARDARCSVLVARRH